jgi:hypothetical protein
MKKNIGSFHIVQAKNTACNDDSTDTMTCKKEIRR